MIIFPAIDIKDGRPVRLVKGDFGTAAQVAEDAERTAAGFAAEGATHLHMVDLDGAVAGTRKNNDIIIAAAKASGLFTEVGGGIRDAATIEYYLKNGISRVILGSAALKAPDFVRSAVIEYGESIAVGIDARNGFVSVSGWTDDSSINYIEFAKQMEQTGVTNIILTDIGRDGTLAGPNLEMLGELSAAVSCTVTASGGVRDVNDIAALSRMGMYAAICGKSLYSGTLTVKEALEASKGE